MSNLTLKEITMTKKTKQNFKIGSGFYDEKKELKSENMILKAEIQRLKDENMKQELDIYKLKAELRSLDRSEKQQLKYRINFLECENEEMREKLSQIGDGVDFLNILGSPMSLFNKTVGTLGIATHNEQKANIMHQMLSKVKEPILISKDNKNE